MNKNITITLALAIAFVFAANVKADMVVFDLKSGNGKEAQYVKDLTFTANDNGNGGIDFTFVIDPNASSIFRATSGDQSTSGFYFYNAGEFFDLTGYNTNNIGNYLTGNASSNPAGVSSSDLAFIVKPNESWNSKAGNGGYTGTLTFTVDYNEGSNWDGFLSMISNPSVQFTIGVPMRGMTGSGGSAGYFVTGWSTPETTTATPEPATLAILGLGLAGLGLARARRRK